MALLFLIATQSDPLLLYNHDLTLDECIERSKQCLTGLTLTRINFENKKNIKYEGLCLRSAWTEVDKAKFDSMLPKLVFRDKFCNQRNFHGFKNRVLTVKHSREQSRRLPKCCESLESIYRYDVGAKIDRQAVETKDIYFDHYKKLIQFALNAFEDKTNITIYHKLPPHMHWVLDDIKNLQINICFEYLADVSAANAKTTHHCNNRVNHNVCLCEICLMDEYGAALVDKITENCV